MEKGLAIVTGANGGIGIEITRALAQSGYHVVMACNNVSKAQRQQEILINETANALIEVIHINLASLKSVNRFAEEILKKNKPVSLLMNNAGTIETCFSSTEDGIETTVSVNYLSHYLLTRKLLPVMNKGSRIVNMVSCTYPAGRIEFPRFFTHGRNGSFRRLSVYSNTKLALLLLTFELSKRIKNSGISVNAADPGIVSTNMISMKKWFDPLTDIFFRPFIRTPRKGASTAIELLLNKEYKTISGELFVNNKIKKIYTKYKNHHLSTCLWEETEKIVKDFL
ncbi:MAG: SDR family NAD(P)-dependent oxidoreductase [Rikenellaceae bacterium]|nr:SDR family NAD(P)-dependent oxidoreductase [Rikenellaceae bacterium]